MLSKSNKQSKPGSQFRTSRSPPVRKESVNKPKKAKSLVGRKQQMTESPKIKDCKFENTDDSYSQLLNVDTFSNNDYGLGIKVKSPTQQQVKPVERGSSKKGHTQKGGYLSQKFKANLALHRPYTKIRCQSHSINIIGFPDLKQDTAMVGYMYITTIREKGQIGTNVSESDQLITLHLCGFKFSKDAFSQFGKNLATAKNLKRLQLNQTNVASLGLQDLANAFILCTSIEFLDLQCNDLDDSHAQIISKIIIQQFEMKDALKWKMGLRKNTEVDIGKLGLKHLNISRNLMTSKSAIILSQALKNDQYIRAICLRKNKIGEEGIKEFISLQKQNAKLVQIDLSNNPAYEKSDYKKQLNQFMMQNIKQAIEVYHETNHRLNYEWLNPELLNIKIVIDEDNPKKSSKRGQFIQVASQLAQKLNFSYEHVAQSFLGENFQGILGSTLSGMILQRKNENVRRQSIRQVNNIQTNLNLGNLIDQDNTNTPVNRNLTIIPVNHSDFSRAATVKNAQNNKLKKFQSSSDMESNSSFSSSRSSSSLSSNYEDNVQQNLMKKFSIPDSDIKRSMKYKSTANTTINNGASIQNDYMRKQQTESKNNKKNAKTLSTPQ
ncbi:UNKNOWN [Stylonychia lemnae]|uniref:Leucine Rich Repeat family protein n=1 Tax=Stylonychia lemnae TaxID=5949 RepID=A0A077ZYU6_STYLE|nr:UNKNOWN [Stylonychia lemnae]|eukprot:CDW74317.1 UNKNOWN [Stylonychia lemnae]